MNFINFDSRLITGAFLASAYALQHPTRVRHLILVDPWGFPQKRSLTEQELKAVPPSWVVTIMTGLNAWFNPLALIRAVGPFGFLLYLQPFWL
jgi:pimeloyl-ACP methyl ester carboxylesterase